MYRHLLIPLDATELSIQLVGNAVALARSLGARITFFHAVDDETSLRAELEVLRITDREEYDYARTGRPRELLAKAEAAARASGVPCESRSVRSRHPAQAIVAAAREAGCDLIFLASHGNGSRLGLALASDTMGVLLHSGLPVLVSSVGEPRAPERAISVMRDEHRSPAAALHAWTGVLALAREAGAAAHPQDMRDVLAFLAGFRSARHHPKEEQSLFPRLRARTPAFDAELEELERQHVRDGVLLAELDVLVGALEDAVDEAARIGATRELEHAVIGYAEFQWDHLGREEAVILPAAQQWLQPQDWEALNGEFGDYRGPETPEQQHLLARIVAHGAGSR